MKVVHFRQRIEITEIYRHILFDRQVVKFCMTSQTFSAIGDPFRVQNEAFEKLDTHLVAKYLLIL